MADNKHTPGPWRTDEWLIGEQKRQQTVVVSSRVCVAYVQKPYPPKDGESEANARLIAAAPEMIAALEMVNTTWQQTSDGCWIISDATMREVRAAIAKSKGA